MGEGCCAHSSELGKTLRSIPPKESTYNPRARCGCNRPIGLSRSPEYLSATPGHLSTAGGKHSTEERSNCRAAVMAKTTGQKYILGTGTEPCPAGRAP